MKKTLLILLFTQLLFSTEIRYKIDNGSFQKGHSAYLTPEQNLTLRFDINNAKSIRWYQIIPDTSKFYKNANYPWEKKNPYKWCGYGKIDYKRVIIKSFNDKKELVLTSKILKANRPKNNPYYNAKLGSFWFEAEAILKSGKVVKSKGFAT